MWRLLLDPLETIRISIVTLSQGHLAGPDTLAHLQLSSALHSMCLSRWVQQGRLGF